MVFRAIYRFAFITALVSLLMAVVITVSCGPTEEEKDILSIMVVMNPGGIKDKSYNALMWSGLQDVIEDFRVEVNYRAPDTLEGGVEAVNEAVEEEYEVIILMPRLLVPEVESQIKENHEVRFIAIDKPLDYENTTSINFDNYQAGYLAGFIASEFSERKTIGFLGADKTTMTTDLNKGFINGARRNDEEVEVLSGYLEDFQSLTDREVLQRKVEDLFSKGVDVIFSPTGYASLTVYELTAKANKLAVGFGSNQDYYEEGYIITSVLRRLDMAIYEVMEDMVRRGEVEAEYNYDLDGNYIDYTVDNFSDLFLTEEFKVKLKHIKDELKSEKVS